MNLHNSFLIVESAIFLSLLLAPTPAQTTHVFVTLRVKHNGAALSSPKRVTLAFGKQRLALALKAGRFEVPLAVVRQKEVRLLAQIGDERIKISGIPGSAFQQDDWTLILADRHYDADNQWVVPKDATVRSSCILLFESKSAEGTALFDPHCRFHAVNEGRGRPE